MKTANYTDKRGSSILNYNNNNNNNNTNNNKDFY